MPRFKKKFRKKRRRKASRKSVRKNAKTGRGIDKAQSKMLVKLARQAKANRPELKYLEFGNFSSTADDVPVFTSGLVGDFYLISAVEQTSIIDRTTGSGDRIGDQIKPKIFEVAITIENTTTVQSSYHIWVYWVNLGMIPNALMTTAATVKTELFPSNFVRRLGDTPKTNISNITQMAIKRWDSGRYAQATTIDLALQKGKSFRPVSSKSYVLNTGSLTAPDPLNPAQRNMTTNVGRPSEPNHFRKHYFNFKFPPNHIWEFPQNKDIAFSLNRGWTPVIAISADTGGGDMKIDHTGQFFWRDP